MSESGQPERAEPWPDEEPYGARPEPNRLRKSGREGIGPDGDMVPTAEQRYYVRATAGVGVRPGGANNSPKRLAEFGQSIRGIVFDMGDVLYDATVWRRWLLRVLNRMGLHTHYASFYRVWDRTYLEAVHRGERDYDEAFCDFPRAPGLADPQFEDIGAAGRRPRREIEARAGAFPGVRDTIAYLSERGLRLGVLSDSEQTAERLTERLGTFGMEGLFQAVVSSRDLCRTKPDPACYLAALDALELTARETAFVGHDTDEIAGARAMGMPTIAFNYEPTVVADLYVEQFEMLRSFVLDVSRSVISAA